MGPATPVHPPPPPFAGYGLGLRRDHYRAFLETRVPVDFVEVVSENFMVAGGRPLAILRSIRERHPVALHGVSMSVGSADGLRRDYLVRLKALVAAPPAAAMLAAPAGVIVWRRGHVACLRVLAAPDADALLLARAERSFRALCARLVDRLGADAGVAQAGALLADWIASELLTRVSVPRQP